MFDPDEAEGLASALLMGADAARQATRDLFSGPAVVVELIAGEEPQEGVELSLASTGEVERECCVMMLQSCEEVAALLTRLGEIVGDPIRRRFDGAAASMRRLLRTTRDKLGIEVECAARRGDPDLGETS
jgi:hypothetical protein